MAIRDPNPGTIEFATPASDATIESVAAALRANNIEAVLVENADDAVQRVLELVPEGAEVNSGKSKNSKTSGCTRSFTIPATSTRCGRATWRWTARPRRTRSAN